MKKQLVFTTLENQGDIQLEYSKKLSYQERLVYLGQLQRVAYGEPQPIVRRMSPIICQETGETDASFFQRFADCLGTFI
jgi:hypothetical protein